MSYRVDGSRYTTRRRNYVVNVQESKAPIPGPGNVAPPAKSDGHKMSKNTNKVFLGLLCLVLAAGAFTLWHFTLGKPKNPLPVSIRQSVSYSLYYPTAKPAGYALDDSSVKNTNGTIFYNLAKPGSQPIIISQQAAPKGFDPKAMFQHNPLPTSISPLGTIYDLSYKNQSRFMIDSTNSLIFISSGSKISNSQLQKIVNGLKLSQ